MSPDLSHPITATLKDHVTWESHSKGRILRLLAIGYHVQFKGYSHSIKLSLMFYPIWAIFLAQG